MTDLLSPFHPRAAALIAFTSGELDGAARGHVARHLAQCARCRNAVGATRALEVAARALASPQPREDALERILARRARGDRVVLPANDVESGVAGDRPGESRGSPSVFGWTGAQMLSTRAGSRLHGMPVRWATGAAAAIVFLAFGWYAAPHDAAATPNGGELSFSVSGPRPGDVVRASYRPDPRFRRIDPARGGSSAGALPSGLVLRGRFRVAADEPYQRIPAEDMPALTLGSDGRYHGQFIWPDSAVYGEFAIEDSAADIVDSNHRALWSLVAAARDGRPSESGIEQQSNALMGRNWTAAYEAARRRMMLYPASLSAWESAVFFEHAVLGVTGSANALAADRVRFDSMNLRLRQERTVTGDNVAAMMWFARTLGDSASVQYWRRRLISEFPANPMAVQDRAIEIRSDGRNPRETLQRLEALWNEVGPAHRNLMLIGLFVAEDMHDSAAVRRWGDRLVQPRQSPQSGGDDRWVATLFTQYPSLRAEGLSRLRQQIASIHAITSRPRDTGGTSDNTNRQSVRSLLLTRAEQARADSVEIARRLETIGSALVASGAYRAAVDTLELATASGWNPSEFREVARLELVAGDTMAALRHLARVMVDPATTAHDVDSLRALIQSVDHATPLTARLARARREMHERVLAARVDRPLQPDARVATNAGTMVELQSLLDGHVTLVAFWSRWCGPSLADLGHLDATARALRVRGIRTVAITDEAPSSAIGAFLRARSLTFNPFYDTHHDAGLAFNAWGTPAYFVVDQHGIVRFEYSSLDEVLAQATVLNE